MSMESYIVRIYRRIGSDVHAGAEVVGYLETPVTGNRYPFHSMNELVRIMERQLGGPLSQGAPPSDLDNAQKNPR